MASTDSIVAPENSEVAQIIFKIQQCIFPRRIRIKDVFRDFDPLRTMRVTKPQFLRALANLNLKGLTVEEIEKIAAFFKDGPGAPASEPQNQMKVYLPQDVNYGEFSNCVDEVFGPTLRKLEETPTASVPRPGALLGDPGFQARAVANPAELNGILHKLALLAKTRGVVFKYCFQDFDRGDSASLTVPRRGGSCTVPQFLRSFPFTGDISKPELDLLLDRYQALPAGDGPLGATISYQALHDDISEAADAIKAEPCPTSLFKPRPDGKVWTSEGLAVVQRLQAAVVGTRARVAEYFIDFDNLRKGYCPLQGVKSVFSLLKLSPSVQDMQELCQIYCRPSDGMFHYARFCQDIDSAFTKDELEKEPLTRISVTDKTTTLPARRDSVVLSEEEIAKVDYVEEEIASRIKERRILLRPMFEDFDPCRRGHVTRSQFARAMETCGFRLDEASRELLCKRYCDLGNDREFNYMDFNYKVDPRSREEDLAQWQSLQPYQHAKASKYFEYTGQITPFKSAAQGA